MLTEITIKYGDKKIPVHIIRSRRKSKALQIKSDQTVYARVPSHVSDEEIRLFVKNHLQWIIEKYDVVAAKQNKTVLTNFPAWDDLTSKQRALIKDKITKRVDHYSSIMGVSIGRISVRNQKTRWGSCSSKGNVNFNYRLYYMEEDLLDYVVVHELAHRKHMNHSPAFWREVAKYCPDYSECRRRLKNYSLN